MTTHPIQPSENSEDAYDPNIEKSEIAHGETQPHNEKSKVAPLTSKLAAAAGGGIAGATIGRVIGGKVGATIGAVVGGVTGVVISKDAASKEDSHTVEVAANQFKNAAEDAVASSSNQDLSGQTIDKVRSEPTTVESQPVAENVSSLNNQPGAELLAKTHYQLGVDLGRQGQLEEAIEEFQEALDFAPESAETHYNLGLAYSKQGDVEQALEHMQQAKELCAEQGKVQGIQAVEQTIEVIETEQP